MSDILRDFVLQIRANFDYALELVECYGDAALIPEEVKFAVCYFANAEFEWVQRAQCWTLQTKYPCEVEVINGQIQVFEAKDGKITKIW